MKLRLALLALAFAVPHVGAQDVHLRGDDHTRAASVAREVLARGTYIRIDRDTVLPETFRAPADLVVVDADVRLAGQVVGTAVVLGGHFFLRPGSVVGGSIAVIDGGVYPSGRAQYGTIFESNPSTRIAVSAEGDSTLLAELEPPPGPAAFAFGLHGLPTYDRVNGISVAGGITLNPFRREAAPTLGAWIGYRERNPDKLGGGVLLRAPLGSGVELAGEASRATRTNDAWARGDISNSAGSLLAGLDYRNYYDADRFSVFLRRPLSAPLVTGESWIGPRLGVQVEDARSLEVQDPPSLFGDLDRLNPAVVEERITSVFAGAELHWVGRLSRVTLDAQVERGHLQDESPEFEQDFTQLLAWGRYSTTAFRTHLLNYSGRVMLPLGDGAPPQRYAMLGGAPTIPTLTIGEMFGDHLVFAEGTYAIPFPRLAVPALGIPSLQLTHIVGAAWAGDDEPDWVQNVGAGIMFPLVGVRVLVDPADPDRVRVLAVASVLRM